MSVKIYPRKEDINLDKSEVLESISDWEEKTARKLPKDYRHFLLTYFGGFPYPACFDLKVENLPIFLDELTQEIVEFYPWYYIQEVIEKKLYYNGYPQGYLIIASVHSPIHLLMGVRDDNWRKHYLWYHSTVDWGDEDNSEQSLVPVANSFSGLISSLYDDGSELARSGWERGNRNGIAVPIEF